MMLFIACFEKLGAELRKFWSKLWKFCLIAEEGEEETF